jgi:ADP-ribosylglycohydrolase
MMRTGHPGVERAYGVLLGQAAGDALGAPTENMSRLEIVRAWDWVDDFLTHDPAGTDDTEYAVLTAWNVLEHGAEMCSAHVADSWRRVLLTQAGDFQSGGFSEMAAIANLRRGLVPPDSGNDHHEPFSDGAAMRVSPIGIFCAGNPAEAARLAAEDARVSHARDGVHCAEAIAAGVAVAVTTDRWQDVVDAALAHIPLSCWTSRLVRRALDVARNHTDARSALGAMCDAVVVSHYPWSDIGPEATALAFGVFAAGRGDYVDSVLAGVNAGRDSDTIAAMAGALAGGLNGISRVPVRWREAVNVVRGRCIHATAGTRLDQLAERLAMRRTHKEVGNP